MQNLKTSIGRLCIWVLLWRWFFKMTQSSPQENKIGNSFKEKYSWYTSTASFIYLITLKYLRNRYNDLLLQRQSHTWWFQIISKPCQLYLVRCLLLLQEFERCHNLPSQKKCNQSPLQKSYLFGVGVNEFLLVQMFIEGFFLLFFPEKRLIKNLFQIICL